MKQQTLRSGRHRHLARLNQIAVLAVAVSTCVSLPLIEAGCGGSGPASGGRLAVTVKWPQPSGRLIPTAAQSIRAVLNSGSTTLDSQLLVRPSQPPWTTTATFNNVQPGNVTLNATAYPNADGSGTSQAAGSVPVTVTSGSQSSVSLTMATTIKTLTVTPPTPSVAVGSQIQLAATAYDGSGNAVLVTPGNISWTVGTGGHATLSPTTGHTTNATGVSAGTQTVTATESESKISGNTTVTVSAPSGGCTSGPVTGPGFLAKSAWPKFGGPSLGNSGKSAGSGAKGVLKWTTTIGKGGDSQAVLGPDGTLYIATFYDSKFYAINSATGSVKWSFTADSYGTVTPAVSTDGTVYFGSSLYFYALDTATGTQKWRARADVSASPTIGLDGTVYAAGARGLVAYDPANGKVKWYNSNGYVGNDYVSPPIGADGTIYGGGYASPGLALYAQDGKCGGRSWSVPLNMNSLALGADGTIYVTADYGFSANTRVVAINPADGSTKWSASNISVQPTPPAIDDARGEMYVLDVHGQLTALSTSNGAKKWSFQAPVSAANEGQSNSSPTIGSDGTVYFVVYDGLAHTSAMYAMDSATGQPKWTYKLPGNATADSSTPTVGPDGVIYIVDRANGTLYAVK